MIDLWFSLGFLVPFSHLHSFLFCNLLVTWNGGMFIFKGRKFSFSSWFVWLRRCASAVKVSVSIGFLRVLFLLLFLLLLFCFLRVSRCLRRACLRLFIVALSPLLRSSLLFWSGLSICICHMFRCILWVVSSCRLLLIFAYSLLHGYVLEPLSCTHSFILVVTRRGDNKSFGTVGFPKGLCLRGDDLRVFVYLWCEPLSRTLRRASLVCGLPCDLRFFAFESFLSVLCDLCCGRRVLRRFGVFVFSRGQFYCVGAFFEGTSWWVFFSISSWCLSSVA